MLISLLEINFSIHTHMYNICATYMYICMLIYIFIYISLDDYVCCFLEGQGVVMTQLNDSLFF